VTCVTPHQYRDVQYQDFLLLAKWLLREKFYMIKAYTQRFHLSLYRSTGKMHTNLTTARAFVEFVVFYSECCVLHTLNEVASL